MKIKKTENGIFAVFESEEKAEKWHWLFGAIFRRCWVSFGGLFNAYKLK